MSERVLKVAITGLGVSRSFLPEWMEAPEAEVVLVHDVDEERARKVAERFRLPRWTADFGEVLRSGADIVDVSTPNHVHEGQAIAALEAGKHVLCQKPMAPTVDACRRMADAARRSGRSLGMFMNMRSDPVAEDLRRAIAEGRLGRIASARIRTAHRNLLGAPRRDHWRAKRENIGGGCFMQLGVHSLNLVQWLVQEPVVSVMGYARNLHARDVLEGEDVCVAAGEFEGGALVAMEAGYSSVGGAIEVYGTEGHFVRTEGTLFLELDRDFDGDLISYRRPAGPEATVRVDPAADEPREGRLRAERNQHRAFARAILAGRPPPVPAEEGLRDVAIIQSIYRSAGAGRRVAVRELLEGDGQAPVPAGTKNDRFE